jgi:Zn-dependent protease
MPFDATWLADRLMLLIPLLLSLSVHEWAHAWSAWRLGDDTAALMGRLTLNPAAHIDPIGTLLLPLLGVPFGWARPVPVNPLRFRRSISMQKGMMITAAAGPISNLVIALGSLVVLAVSIRFLPDTLRIHDMVLELLWRFVFLNVILAAFNALPIPPLDGSRVMDGLVPRSLRPAWESFAQAGPIALAAVILLPMLAGISLFYWPMQAAGWLLALLLWVLGAGGA